MRRNINHNDEQVAFYQESSTLRQPILQRKMNTPTSKPSIMIVTVVLLCLQSHLRPVQVEGFSSVSPRHHAISDTRCRDVASHSVARDSNDYDGSHDNKNHFNYHKNHNDSSLTTRRNILIALSVAPFTGVFNPQQIRADVDVSTIEMKEFKDPYGMFAIDVPKGFFTLRRTAKGDLPDSKTGKGRRGSSIFTAGDLAKAEVIAVERFPTRLLLEENGIEATGSLKSFPDLGEPSAIANLLNIRREKESTASTVLDQSSIKVSADGKELEFKLRTEIQVQRPELLMEQYGVSELIRVTIAKASLESSDGNILAVFASALEPDFLGPDGVALRKSVDSFRVNDREFGF